MTNVATDESWELDKVFEDKEEPTNSTLNFSLNTKTAVSIAHWKWSILVTCETTYLAVGLFLLTTCTHFIWKTVTVNVAQYPGIIYRTRHTTRNLLFAMVLFLLIIGLGRFATVLWALVASPSLSQDHCEILRKVSATISILDVSLLYSFLWMRQHTICNEPSIKRLITPCFVRFTRFLIVLIVVSCAGAIIGIIVIPVTYDSDLPDGSNRCSFHVNPFQDHDIMIYTSYATMIVIQGCIVFTFATILKLHRLQFKARTSNRLRRLIHSCAVASAVIFVTDVATVALRICGLRLTEVVHVILLDTDCLINQVCVIFCFANWRKMVNPTLWASSLRQYDSNIRSRSAGKTGRYK